MSALLAPAELVSLTGCTQGAAQVRWLKSNQWPYVVGADGIPKVARSFFESVLGPSTQVVQSVHGIDLAALDAVMHKQ